MNIPMYQVDGFTSTVFSGNPAAVCLLDTWLEDTVLQAVAGEPSDLLSRALGNAPNQVYASAEDLMAVFDSETLVAEMQPDMSLLAQLDCRGIIVTAPGGHCDFVSRFFGPRVGVPEDPVTGSAHCVLIPYWASVLGKKDLHARQVSKRGGELFCRLVRDRVRIAGRAALYLEGMIKI